MIKLLKRLIKASGKTKKQIALEIGVQVNAVHAWLRGAKGRVKLAMNGNQRVSSLDSLGEGDRTLILSVFFHTDISEHFPTSPANQARIKTLARRYGVK